MSLKWLSASVTQGSNDAFAETEFSTGLSNVTRQAFRIRCIEFLAPALPGVDSVVQLCLRRNSAAALTFNGQAIIAGMQRWAEFTTSGMTTQEQYPNRQLFEKDMEFLIVEEALYFQIDSNATSATNSALVRIAYETRSITENERLAIQAQTAQG